jgi:hypothetical protein
MGDENWIYGYDPETKQQSSQWKILQSPRDKKAWQIRNSTKNMLVFFDVMGIVHHEFAPPNTVVNSGATTAGSITTMHHRHVPENHRVCD